MCDMDKCVTQQLEKQLGYFEAVLQYLDTSGNLPLLKAQCEKYKKSKNLVYRFKVLIDPADICEANAILGNLILQEPNTAIQIFQQVIYKTVQVLDLLPGQLSLSQVAVILRLSSLPVIQELNIIKSTRCLSRIYNKGIFCSLTGVVTGLSAVSKYTLSARYYCTDEDCQGHHGNHFIRIYTPGASEAQIIRKDFTCTFCSSTLAEEKSSRSLSERVVAEVIQEQIMSEIHASGSRRCRGQAIPVFIRDDLTKLVEIGETYQIIGTTRKDVHDDKMMLTLEANNIKKVKNQISAKKLLQELPRNVLKLYKGDISPPGSYFSLKLAILLSLMSRRCTKTKPIHLLAVGTDTEIISRLLQFGLRFKDSSTALTAGQYLTGQVTVDRYNSALYFVEGGLLHLAQGGVCYVADISRLKKSTIHSLQSALTGGKIVTDVGPKFTGGLPHHIEQNLGSRVWGYSGPSGPKKQVSDDSDVFVGANTGEVSKSLLDAFSIVSLPDCGDMTSREQVESQLMESCLSAHMYNGDILDADSTLPITAKDMQQFVQFASQLRPKFTKEAETIIHRYYLTCRKSRSTPDGTDVPVNADQTVLSLAYSHAKLALRNEVTIQDALMAIKFYEEYLTNRFGYSSLNVQPIPHVNADILNHCIGPDNDKQMKDFHKNLLRFCSLASGLEE